MIPTNKNIAILHPYANKMGWAIKMMLYISHFLQWKNNNIVFYTLFFDSRLFLDEKIDFNIQEYRTFKILKIGVLLYIAFKIRKSDYIIIWNSPMHFVWVISKLLFFSKAKLIWWNHHYPWYYGKNTNLCRVLKRYIEKYCVKKIDVIVSNSYYLKWVVDTIWSVDSKILFPILAEEYIDKTHYIETKKDKNIIFTYGRWESGKNLQLVFEVYQKLKPKILDLVLIIWWVWKELTELFPKYSFDKDIQFLWHLNMFQIQENCQSAKVFLFPSLIDSFWIVKIEALSSWVPVVCLKSHEFEEIIHDGVNWFCVKTQEQFIKSVYDILTNDVLRQTLSTNARESIIKFTHWNFEQQLNNIFVVDIFK